MGLWDGNLRASPGDILIDGVVLLLTAFACSFQVYRLMSFGSTKGISPYFLLFNAVFSNLQLANTLLLTSRAWPTDKSPVLELIGSGELSGSQAFGAAMGLAQVALQWACSVTLVMFFSAYGYLNPSPNASVASYISISTSAFIHAALFLFPAVVIALPKPSPRTFGIDFFTGFSLIVNTWVSSLFVALQSYPQFLEFRRMAGAVGSLSLTSLAIRALVMLAMAVRWLLRLGLPTWKTQYAPPTLWYQWGWLPFNYIIDGLGCVVLVIMYLRAGHSSGTLDVLGEEAALLA